MSQSTTYVTACRHCGGTHGVLCPAVKAIEYHPDGSIKRVEFRDATLQPVIDWQPAWMTTIGIPPVSST